jgi:cell division protein FtsQ
MDGRRRFLRSVTRLETRFAPAPAFAPAPRLSRRWETPRGSGRKRQSFLRRFLDRLAGPGYGAALAFAVIGSAGLYGVVRGGQFDTFVAAEGAPIDVLAKAAGFAIETITITGLSELDESRILAAAQITPRNSLPFLDVAKVRERLTAIPLVKEAAVAKLYPNRLLINIEERQPFALWQKDGDVKVVAAEGIPLDEMRGPRFADLPHVVGAGANEKAAEYVALLDAAGDLKSKIRAGIFVSHRRWILKTTNGLDIHLPEKDPTAAVATLMDLQRSSGILDKDVLSLDMRQPGRVVVRLGDEASAARADKSTTKGKAKGGQT